LDLAVFFDFILFMVVLPSVVSRCSSYAIAEDVAFWICSFICCWSCTMKSGGSKAALLVTMGSVGDHALRSSGDRDLERDGFLFFRPLPTFPPAAFMMEVRRLLFVFSPL
jgi:hypothetical protein